MKRVKNKEAAICRCSVKEVFLKISPNSEEHTFARVSSIIKLQTKPAILLEK